LTATGVPRAPVAGGPGQPVRPPASGSGAGLAPLAGSVAAGAALSATVLADALSDQIPSLVLVVGQRLIRLTPGSTARSGIETFGTADKPAIVIGIVSACLLLGWGLGLLTRHWRIAGPFGMTVFGLAGWWAVVTTPGGSSIGGLAGAAAGAVVGAAVLDWLARQAGAPWGEADARADLEWVRPGEPVRPAGPPDGLLIGAGVNRRRFLIASGLVSATSVAAAGASKLLKTSPPDPSQDLSLPSAAGPVTKTAEGFDVEGISPLVTPTADFYRIDEALIVPRVDQKSWKLSLDGMVDRPFSITYDELLAMEQVVRPITLSCVSNSVGGELVGTALWQGVLLAPLLERAGVQAGADQLVGHSVDEFTTGFPTSVALDGRDAMIAVGMNGEPLPAKHGFPARLVVPGLYGYVSATKWLTRIELTTFGTFRTYWVKKGWAAQAPVKLTSRIDVPRYNGKVRAGMVPLAGVAWATHSGVSKVEVQVGDGPWQEAELSDDTGDDTWRQWVYRWDAPVGHHIVRVRATDRQGQLQDQTVQGSFPDGATGWHYHPVTVE
jgi:DMSO/TMAO reductase YedYZ molybdopterin-dependent catalytic subunit